MKSSYSSQRCARCIVSLAIVIVSALTHASAQEDNESAYKFILDYDVPASPAFTVLGVAPAQVATGSASKPVVVSLLNQIATNGSVQGGMAIDFSPYFVFGGQLKNIVEYRLEPGSRIAANTLFSFGTVALEEDTSSIRFGLGVRSTLFDAHDLLQDKNLGADIDAALTPDDGGPGGGDGEEMIEEVDLRSAYEKARARVLEKSGPAMAVGYGLDGILQNSVADFDSIRNTRHQTWVGLTYWFGGGFNISSMYHGIFSNIVKPEHLIGFALQKSGSTVAVSGEVVFSSITNRIEAGGIVEVRLVSRVSAILSLESDRDGNQQHSLTKIRFKTNIKWNLSE